MEERGREDTGVTAATERDRERERALKSFPWQPVRGVFGPWIREERDEKRGENYTPR